MKKQKNNMLVIIIIIVVILLLVVGEYIIYKNNYVKTQNQALVNENNTIFSLGQTSENTTKNEQKTDNNTGYENKLSQEENSLVKEYINRICVKWVKLPTFENINDADKKWIYSHIETREDGYYISETQIKNELKEVFGPDLIIDVQSDTSSSDGYFIPQYNAQKGKYEFLPIGGLITIYYTIDYIQKSDDNYIVNIIEYSIERDLENDADKDKAVFTYDESTNSWKKIFEVEQDSSDVIEKEVLNQKDKFQSYNITLKTSDDGSIYVEKIEKI